MGQAEQLNQAVTSLQAAAGKFTEGTADLATMVGTISGVMATLNQENQGMYVDAARKAWSMGARDAYRVMDAMNAAASAMTTLASGIESHVSAIQSYENLSSISAISSQSFGSLNSIPAIGSQSFENLGSISEVSPSVLATANTAWSDIASLSQTFVTTLGTSAEPSVVGACSLGNEPLKDGQTDGTDLVITVTPDGQLQFGPADGSWDATSGGDGGDNDPPGAPPAGGFWNNMCSNPINPSDETQFLEQNKVALSKLGLVWKVTKQGATLLAVNTTVSTLYSAQLAIQTGGVNQEVLRNIEGGVVMSLVDGYAYVNAAQRITVTGKNGLKYKLANCPAPYMIIQALLGAGSGVGYQLTYQAIKGPSTGSAPPTLPTTPVPTSTSGTSSPPSR